MVKLIKTDNQFQALIAKLPKGVEQLNADAFDATINAFGMVATTGNANWIAALLNTVEKIPNLRRMIRSALSKMTTPVGARKTFLVVSQTDGKITVKAPNWNKYEFPVTISADGVVTFNGDQVETLTAIIDHGKGQAQKPESDTAVTVDTLAAARRALTQTTGTIRLNTLTMFRELLADVQKFRTDNGDVTSIAPGFDRDLETLVKTWTDRAERQAREIEAAQLRAMQNAPSIIPEQSEPEQMRAIH